MPLFKSYRKNKKACRTVKMATGKDEKRLGYTTSSQLRQTWSLSDVTDNID